MSEQKEKKDLNNIENQIQDENFRAETRDDLTLHPLFPDDNKMEGPGR